MRTSLFGRAKRGLLHQDDVFRLPRPIKPGLQRTIETQNGAPGFSRNGLDPVAFPALGWLWSKPDGVASIFIRLEVGTVAVEAAKLLVRFQKRARLRVVDYERPIIVDRHVGWDRDRIRLATVDDVIGSIRPRMSTCGMGSSDQNGRLRVKTPRPDPRRRRSGAGGTSVIDGDAKTGIFTTKF